MQKGLISNFARTRAAFNSAALGIRDYFRQLTPAILVGVALPYALTLAFVTSVGGMLQQSAFGMLNNEAPSVYEAVYQDNIMRLPSLGDWLLYGLSWPWLLCGALIAILSVPQRKLWRILLATAVFASLALALTDLLTSGLTGALDAQNVAGNLFGGPLAALVVSPALLLFVGLAGDRPPARIARLVTGAVVMVGSGLVVCALAFFAFKILFQPVAQKLEVVLTRPVSGTSFGSVSLDGSKKDNRFSFLPTTGIGGELDVKGTMSGVNVEWRSLRNEPFTVTATLILDCGFTDIKAIPIGPAFVVERGVSRVAARFDSQMTFVRTAVDPSASYVYRPTMPTSYWIDDAGKDQVKITHFVSPEDPIEAKLSSATAIALTGTMLRHKNGAGYPEARTLVLELGPKKVQMIFAKPRIGRTDRTLQCHAGKPDSVGTVFQSNESTMVGGVLLRFVRETSPSFYAMQDAQLRIGGVNGSFAVDKVAIDPLYRGSLGKTGFLTFSGAIESFRLDGKDVEHREHDVFQAIGDLQASWLSDGKLAIRGTVGQLWRASNRLSPTRWERMPTEVKLALLPLLLGLGGALEFCRRQFLKHRDADLAGSLT